ncbi:MAG: hypothetical protein FJ216_01210 [Ignavibacteria bacterium]|nr:hypothetical protein [Ignavibacteria bacterium]
MKKKIKILIADDISLSGLKYISKKNFTVKKLFNKTNKEILSAGLFFNVIVIKSSRLTDDTFIRNSGVEVIATCSKGIDHIDGDSAKKNNVKIINSDNGNYISTGEHTFALILSIAKQMKTSEKKIREGNFIDRKYPRYELYGKKIGVIGVGKVGGYVVRLAKAFGMQVLANDIDRKVIKKYSGLRFVPLEYLLKNSDIVTLHIPLNKKNENFLSRDRLYLLRKQAVLINTSRGKIVDEITLISLLKRKKIFYAGIDVFESEPYINRNFLHLDNVVLTNHIAGKTLESKERTSCEIFRKIKEYYKK